MSSIAFSLRIAYLVGLVAPFYYLFQPKRPYLAIDWSFIDICFCGFCFLPSVPTRDKAKAIGIALLFWFYFSLIYDGLLLWVVYNFNDYPPGESHPGTHCV